MSVVEIDDSLTDLEASQLQLPHHFCSPSSAQSPFPQTGAQATPSPSPTTWTTHPFIAKATPFFKSPLTIITVVIALVGLPYMIYTFMLAKWTATKDYIEYCENNPIPECRALQGKYLGPPPYMSDDFLSTPSKRFWALPRNVSDERTQPWTKDAVADDNKSAFLFVLQMVLISSSVLILCAKVCTLAHIKRGAHLCIERMPYRQLECGQVEGPFLHRREPDDGSTLYLIDGTASYEQISAMQLHSGETRNTIGTATNVAAAQAYPDSFELQGPPEELELFLKESVFSETNHEDFSDWMKHTEEHRRRGNLPRNPTMPASDIPKHSRDATEATTSGTSIVQTARWRARMTRPTRTHHSRKKTFGLYRKYEDAH